MSPNSAFFKASMSQSDPFDLSCMGVTAEAERRRAGTGAREEVRFAGDSPLEGDGFEPSVPPADMLRMRRAIFTSFTVDGIPDTNQ
jgi:hypothetical protein